jgi:Flp pilus assembly pilin Flp
VFSKSTISNQIPERSRYPHPSHPIGDLRPPAIIFQREWNLEHAGEFPADFPVSLARSLQHPARNQLVNVECPHEHQGLSMDDGPTLENSCFDSLPLYPEEFGMKKVLSRVWKEQDGVLSFEWVLLVTLLTFGIVGGVAAGRDAIIDELGDVAQAMLALDQSFTIAFPLLIEVHTASTSSASDSSFTDALTYTDCDRAGAPTGQTPQNVEDTDS